MNVSDNSAGGEAGQFHSTRWTLVMVSADGPSQSVSLALCDAPIAAEGGPMAVKAESGGSVERLAALPDYHTDHGFQMSDRLPTSGMYVAVELR